MHPKGGRGELANCPGVHLEARQHLHILLHADSALRVIDSITKLSRNEQVRLGYFMDAT